MTVDVVIVGSVALDSVKTPFGKVERALGGSATYASVAAGYFCRPGIVGVVGKDFPKQHTDFLEKRGIDLQGLSHAQGKTFFWEGEYGFDLNQAVTKKTEVNVFENFRPELPEAYRKADYLFLGNIHPELQLDVLKQMDRRPKLVLADTMNMYISSQRAKVLEVVKEVDICLMNDSEARMLFNTPNLIKAAREILKLDSDIAIIKKGEHGSIMVSENDFFAMPAYPLENVIDPTGAGDCFAGALIGYLAKSKDLGEKNFRKAIVYASTVASFNAEGFSLDNLKKTGISDIEERVKSFREIVRF
ncbi:MAG: sugar kinase [Candidatus Diapherotrites archaeon]|nr:sugar kinase [Candidatus Diapherotrites archaeon]